MGRNMRLGGLISAVMLLVAMSACRPSSSAQADPPTLAILLVVDQLRPELLDRYDSAFVGGFRRLLDEGYSFTNATHDHGVTTTGPGHTTLATGVYPTRHGIVGNSWSEFLDGEWRSIYSMEDLSRPVLGHPELPGRSSANIDRSGLADWIAGNDQGSRVVSISKKDRAAIGLATQARGEVYWLVERDGGFVTSDFYHAEYPAWITEFNATTMPLIYSDTVWESRTPPQALALSRPDTSRFEFDRRNTFFPHRASEAADVTDPGSVNRWRHRLTPFPDRAVVALAIEAIEEFPRSSPLRTPRKQLDPTRKRLRRAGALADASLRFVRARLCPPDQRRYRASRQPRRCGPRGPTRIADGVRRLDL